VVAVALRQDAKLGMAMRFHVVVDEIDLGGWATCKGLQVNFESKAVDEGANYEYQVILPERVKYSAIELTRAMNQQDSAAVQRWLSQVVSKWYDATSPTDYSARTARITLLDAFNGEVASWTLRSIYPKRWSGPNLNASGHDIAVETLELVHEGFL
jgi:phage tail-like protein